MKKLASFFTLLALALSGFAQTNYYKLSIGAGAGPALAFAQPKKKTLTFAGYGTIDYYFTPFVSLGIEGQKGELAGGDVLFDPDNLQFINSYLAGNVNLKVSLGEFISDSQRRIPIFDFLSGVYGGVGLGIIKNNITNVRYYDVNYYPGDDKSTEEIIPINLGVNFNIRNSWGYNRFSINANLQTVLDLGEGLDGYAFANGKSDIYTYLSAGVKYHFGFMGLDKRR